MAQPRADIPTLVLSAGLSLALILLSLAVVVGVLTDREPITDLSVRALSVAITAAAGVLGFQLGKGKGGTE